MKVPTHNKQNYKNIEMKQAKTLKLTYKNNHTNNTHYKETNTSYTQLNKQNIN